MRVKIPLKARDIARNPSLIFKLHKLFFTIFTINYLKIV